jgi:FixJ family two-component response regulator
MASRFPVGNSRSTARSAGTVLVVEDDPAVRYSLQFSLEAEGYSVRLFADAGSLLADPDLPERGCIVADYLLPDGNGLDLIRMLRVRGVRLPAILLTSNPSMALRRDAVAADVPIVEKPLLGNALSEEIGAAIAHRS